MASFISRATFIVVTIIRRSSLSSACFVFSETNFQKFKYWVSQDSNPVLQGKKLWSFLGPWFVFSVTNFKDCFIGRNSICQDSNPVLQDKKLWSSLIAIPTSSSRQRGVTATKTSAFNFPNDPSNLTQFGRFCVFCLLATFGAFFLTTFVNCPCHSRLNLSLDLTSDGFRSEVQCNKTFHCVIFNLEVLYGDKKVTHSCTA